MHALPSIPEARGYMESPDDEVVACISRTRRIEWEERLLNSPLYRRCRSGLYGPEPLGECEEWDGGFNTSTDSDLHYFRQANLRNYAIWIHEFADRLDVEAENALRTLEHACLALGECYTIICAINT